MRFLLDQNLSPALVHLLEVDGHDAVHVRDIGLSRATDELVCKRARDDHRVLVSADTDFGTLLARTHETQPSFILIRRAANRNATDQARLITENLPAVENDLDAGAIVVLGESTVRIRRLPIGG